MSQISKALKRVQELRRQHMPSSKPVAVRAHDTNTIVADEPMTDLTQAPSGNDVKVFYVVGTVVAVLVSVAVIMLCMMSWELRQNKIIGLEKAFKTQELRINQLITVLNKKENISNNQTRDLVLRLKKENNDMKVRINNAILSSNTNYSSLKDAILDDKQEIDFLNGLTKKLDQKIDSVSMANSQPKDAALPGGN